MIRMESYRIGIIGTGFGARVHAPMFQHHDGFEVAAIASVRGNVEAAKEQSGITNVYTDWRKMLDEESLDLVVVASAVFYHKEMVEAIFAKGIHVLCEKPMAFDSTETEDMMAARDKAEKLGLINHEFRFLPARSKIKDMLADGRLGSLVHVRYELAHPIYKPLTSKRRGWLGRKEDGGGLLNALGSHAIDSLHWWTGSTFKRLMGQLNIHAPEFMDEQGNVEQRTADDAYQIIGTLNNGTTVTMDLVTAARKTDHTAKLEVYGEKGTLIMYDDQDVLVSMGDGDFEKLDLAEELEMPTGIPQAAARYYNAFKPMMDALYDTLETGHRHPTLATFENGRVTQNVIDAIRESSQEGRRITL